MKCIYFSMMVACLFSAMSYAQDDDVYFVPSRNADKQQEKQTPPSRSTYFMEEADGSNSNWAEGRGNGQWDVDEYNRRGNRRDSMETDSSVYPEQADSASLYTSEDADATYTVRLIRFHSPRFGVYVSSPYYDSFFYDPFWTDFWPYNYWAWNSWYGWGYAGWWPWGFGWYDPWYYGPTWAWGHWWGWHHGPAWGGWYPPHHHNPGWNLAGNVRRGPTGGYVAYSRRGNGENAGYPSRYRMGSRYTSRGNALNQDYRPSRNYGTTPSSNRRPSTGNAPSRSYNSNSSRSYSNPSSGSSRSRSGSFSNGGGRSGGGFSTGRSGGGRSFGGGGGARGGRR